MKFKKNITVTLACIITECLISLLPIIFMIYLFFIQNKINEMFLTLLVIPYLIILINICLFIISLIAGLFIKTSYFVEKDFLIVKTKNSESKIMYKYIFGITYDFGDLTKFNTKPSQLILFDKEFKQLISIYNPSITMVYIIKKRCKNSEIEYYHNKRFLFLFSLINGISFIFLLLLKLFS